MTVATARTSRVTCRVCELTFIAMLDQPALLCDNCAVDIPAATTHIYAVWEAAERSYVEATAALTTLLDTADSSTKARYDAVCAALSACGGVPDAALTRRLDATEAKGDALILIVKALRTLIIAKHSRSQIEAWARRALDAVAAWQDSVLP